MTVNCSLRVVHQSFTSVGTLEEVAAMAIVYEDDDVRVIFHRGKSEFILVTFGDLCGFAEGQKFFAEAPVRKSEISCVGFMAKGPNWYPSSNMRRAFESVEHVTAPYLDVVTYGGSMGGYAAIKYSGLARATEVISFCPQWTIDPSECDGVSPGYQNYFVARLSKMAIRQADTSGRIFVLADPSHKQDAFHRNMILRNCKSAISVDVISADHSITSMFAGTQNLLSLIHNVRFENVEKTAAMVSSIRRNSQYRARILLKRAVHRHPYLTYLASNSPKIRRSEWQESITELYGPLIASLVDKGLFERARYVAVSRFGGTNDLDQRRNLILSALSRYKSYLITAHGTIVAFDIASGQLAHVMKRELSFPCWRYCQVSIMRKDNKCLLYFDRNADRYYIGIDQKGSVQAVSTNILSASLIDVDLSADRSFSFRIGELRLSAEPSGYVPARRVPLKEWEIFTAFQTL